MKTRVFLAIVALAITLILSLAAHAQGYKLIDDPALSPASAQAEMLRP